MNRTLHRIVLVMLLAALMLGTLAGCKPQAVVDLKPGVAHAATLEGPDPIVTMKGPSSASPGEIVTYTVTCSVPVTETQTAKEATLHYTPGEGLTAVEAIAPLVSVNIAEVRSSVPTASNPPCYTRVETRTVTVAPTDGGWEILLGHLEPGDSVIVEFKCGMD